MISLEPVKCPINPAVKILPVAKKSRWQGLSVYALSVVLVIATFALRQYLSPLLAGRPLLIIFMLPIIASALIGGFGSGMTATILTAACSGYFIFPPIGSFKIEAGLDLAQWSLLIVNGVLVSFMSELLHRSRNREAEKWRQLAAAQGELRQTDALFHNMFDLAGVGIALVMPDGHWWQVNNKFCEIVGYSREELIDLTFQDITVPEDLQTDLDYVKEMLNDHRQTYTLEKRYQRKDKKVIWINLTVTLVRDADSTPAYFIFIIEDIDARKQTETALKNSEAVLKQAQLLAKIGNWVWDITTNNHVWSEEVFRIYGRDLSLPPAVYPEVKQYFKPESWKCLSKTVEVALETAGSYQCDLEIVRPDGSECWIVARGEALQDAMGKVTELHGTVQDITERKQSEALLRRSQAQLKIFIQEAPTCIAMLDRNLNYLATSTYWLLEYGRGYDNLSDHNHYELFPVLPEAWKLAYQQALSGVAVQNDNDSWIREDGSLQWLRWAVVPWTDETGAIGGIIIFADDITRRKLAEEDIRKLNAALEVRVLERTAELNSANRELDSFAYAVSHDLRAPLRAMSGFSQALIEDYGDQLQGEAKMYLDQIGIASEKMGELIDGLLVLSRCTRGSLHNDEINLSAISESILAEMVRNDPARHVESRVQSGLTVHGDSRMIELVMQNLLSNAWKYSAHKAIAIIEVFAEDLESGRRFCVSDNGAGFDMAYTNRLFQPFQRLHRQEEFPGTGIGLATVQRIVQRLGGNIEAFAEPDKGARFYFTINIGSPKRAADNKD